MWNEEALEASKEIILCESLIDALTFWCAGFRNVTASYGVSGFTEDHRAAFTKHGTKHVWIAYDRDEAGETQRRRAAKRRTQDLDTPACCFRKGMDANEYALKVTPAIAEPGGAAESKQRSLPPPAPLAEPEPPIVRRRRDRHRARRPPLPRARARQESQP